MGHEGLKVLGSAGYCIGCMIVLPPALPFALHWLVLV